MECDPTRLFGDLNTFGYLFESLAARDARVYAAAANASIYHYRERAGELEVDLIVERRDGAWIGVEVKLGSAFIDQAATALLRLKAGRVIRPPAALVVLTATEYAYRRDDAVIVAPLGLRALAHPPTTGGAGAEFGFDLGGKDRDLKVATPPATGDGLGQPPPGYDHG